MDDFWLLPPVARYVSVYGVLGHRSNHIGNSSLMLIGRTWTALTFLTSCCIYAGVISGGRLIFAPSYILKLPVPEIWRIFSSFCITGPRWEVLYDTYFRRCSSHETIWKRLTALVWTYSSTLEKESPRFTRPGDFFFYILFLGMFILVSRPPCDLHLFISLQLIRLYLLGSTS